MIKIVTLFILFILASISDIKTQKIPNALFIMGILSGIIFDVMYPRQITDIVASYVGMIVIFLIGSFRLIGMGDIKMWMVLTVYDGITKSSCIFLLATLSFIVVQLLIDPQKMKLMISGFYQAVKYKKIEVTNYHKYEFIPYVTFFVIMYEIAVIV